MIAPKQNPMVECISLRCERERRYGDIEGENVWCLGAKEAGCRLFKSRPVSSSPLVEEG